MPFSSNKFRPKRARHLVRGRRRKRVYAPQQSINEPAINRTGKKSLVEKWRSSNVVFLNEARRITRRSKTTLLGYGYGSRRSTLVQMNR